MVEGFLRPCRGSNLSLALAEGPYMIQIDYFYKPVAAAVGEVARGERVRRMAANR